jgi:hypothetical protein
MSVDVTVTTDPIELTVVEDNTTVSISEIETISLTISSTGPAGPQGIPGVPGSGAVNSVNGLNGDVVLDTDDISEGTKKYNVQADWDASSGLAEILNKPTSADDISEGVTNKYHVNADWDATSGKAQILNKPTDFISDPAGIDGQIQLNKEGVFYADSGLTYNYVTGQFNVGENITISVPEPLPDNPLAVGGDVDSYLQVNLQNINTGEDATADFIITADDGTDSWYYGDFGYTNSEYTGETLGWDIFEPHDMYLYTDGGPDDTEVPPVYGGNVVIGSMTPGKKVKFFIAHTAHEAHPADIVGEIGHDGLDLPSGSSYSINSVDLPLMTDVSRVELQNIECHGSGFVLARGVFPYAPNGTMGLIVLPYIAYVSDGVTGITRVASAVNVTVDALGDPLVTLYNGLNIICVGADNKIHIFDSQPDLSLYPLMAVVFTAGNNTIIAEFVNAPAYCGEIAERITSFVSDAIHALVISGCAISEGSTPLTLKMSSGYVTINLQKYAFTESYDFYRMYYDAVIGWTIDLDYMTWNKVKPNTYNVMSESLYSEPPGNPLQTIPAGHWSKSLVYRSPNGITYQVYPQTYYDTEDEAKAAALPAIPPGFDVICIFIACIVAKEDDATIGSRIQDIRPYLPRIFGYGAASSGVSLVHAALLGLSADDHTQYYNETRGDARYALLANGVTDGDSHDHSDGDGAQIAYSTLSDKPTLGTAAAENVGYFAVAAHAHEGTAIVSTGEIGGTKFLREDGDGTSSWQTVPNWGGDIADINIDGGTDIGAALTDSDLIIVDDGGGGTNRKSAMSRVKTYIGAATTSTKLDDFATPDDNTDLNANTTNHGLVVKAVAPAANVLNVVGIANAETAYTNKALFDATNPVMDGTAAPGTSLIASHRDHVHASDTSRLEATRGNWKLFYSNGTGVFSEIALGADGTYFKGKGVAAAPEFGALSNLIDVYNVKSYGALGNDDGTGAGGQDDTTYIQAAIDAAEAAGGGIVYFPKGYYKCTATLTVNGPAIHMMGVGCGYNSDIGDFRANLGSALIWRGVAGLVFLDVYPLSGASAQNIKGFRMSGITIDGRNYTPGAGEGNQAATGLRLRSCSGWHLSDLFIQDCRDYGIVWDVLVAGSIGEAHDCTRGIADRINIRQADGAAKPGTAMYLTGSSTANTCMNTFRNIQISYWGDNAGKPAIRLKNSDSNYFENVYCNRILTGVTNWGIVIEGAAADVQTSRANTFVNCSAGANGWIACGTSGGKRPDGTADASFNFTYPSRDNVAPRINTENGEPVPYVAPGASFTYGTSGGSTMVAHDVPVAPLANRITSTAAITTSEVQIIGVTLPANYLKAGTTLKFEAHGVMSNSTTSSTFTVRIRIGAATLTGTIIGSGTFLGGTTARTNAPVQISGMVTVRTDGSSGTAIGNTQMSYTAGTAGGTGTTATAAVDTTVIRVCELTAIGVTGSPSITITNATVTVVANKGF